MPKLIKRGIIVALGRILPRVLYVEIIACFRYFFRPDLVDPDLELYGNAQYDVVHFSTYCGGSGSGRAAARLHEALLKDGVRSLLVYLHASKGHTPSAAFQKHNRPFIFSWRPWLINIWELLLCRLLSRKRGVLQSSARYSQIDCLELLKSVETKVVNLHWINHDMLSIEDIARISEPIVWTLHDMWAFQGVSHLSYDENFKDIEKMRSLGGIDFRTFMRKLDAFQSANSLSVVGVSSWMGDQIDESYLLRSFESRRIPNIVDQNAFFPKESSKSNGIPIILFGGMYNDFNKGGDLLTNIVALVQDSGISVRFLCLGEKASEIGVWGDRIELMGIITEEAELSEVYRSASLFITTSRLESFGLMAAEAVSCGTPVVCFDTSGLRDIVEDGVTGRKAKCFDCQHFSELIFEVLEDLDGGKYQPEVLSEFCRKRFSSRTVAKEYVAIYERLSRA